ncbi:MAG: hypothetical protein ACI81L_000871 [Verrucomicrobiales bacterium]|jgi:hypothetical protein
MMSAAPWLRAAFGATRVCEDVVDRGPSAVGHFAGSRFDDRACGLAIMRLKGPNIHPGCYRLVDVVLLAVAVALWAR